MKLSRSILYQKPRCIRRLGEAIFIKLPLYEANSYYEPIYINDQLFQKIFKQKLSFTAQANFIKTTFSVTLQIIKSTGKQCGFAYVDRQAEDSYNTSLGGNQGSGRAYYSGNCFNIKGEKTPLATSANPMLSNGILSLGHGIWSALIGNSLYDELHVKPSQVLAVLRVDADSCKIIRIDNGSLDKITHFFYQPKALSAKQLQAVAKNLGHLEAEKFIHRILHGAWSAGNTSLKGHLIDYDSVCAVKGRQPQYSFSQYHPDNYFGFEYLGQIKVLKNLVDNASINIEEVSQSALEKKLMCSFKQQIKRGLVYLMGFETHPTLTKRDAQLLSQLAEDFFDLSHNTYFASSQSLDANHPASLFYHLYDFSVFFRIFPLLKFTGKFTVSLGLSYLMGSHLQHEMLSTDERNPNPLEPTVAAILGTYLHASDETAMLTTKARQFIEDYNYLFNKILLSTKDNILHIFARAYTINEDRFYLFPVFSLENLIVNSQTHYSAKHINQLIHVMIQASKRHPIQDNAGNYATDFRLFKEGFGYISINSQGIYRVVIQLYKYFMPQITTLAAQWHIGLRDQWVPASCQSYDEMLQIVSVELPITQLSYNYARDNVFLIHPYALSWKGEKIKLTDFFFPNHDSGYYL